MFESLIFDSDFLIFGFFLFFFFFLFLLLFFGIFLSNYFTYSFFVTIWEVSFINLIGFGCLLFILFFQYIRLSLGFYNFCIFDDLVEFFEFFVVFFSIIFIIISYVFCSQILILSMEYFLIITFVCFASALLTVTYDLLFLYLVLEILSLGSYVLAAYKRFSEFSMESGLKYFVLGSLGSCLFLFGAVSVYSVVGSFGFEDILRFIFPLTFFNFSYLTLLLIIGFFFLFFSFLLKLAVAPFHFWLADIYEGSYFSVMVFFSLVPKYGIFVLLVRLFSISGSSFIFNFYSLIYLIIISLSLVIGSLGAFFQFKFKRFFAYSSIVNVGMSIIGLFSSTFFGLQSLFFFLYVYVLSLSLVFSLFLQMFFLRLKSWFSAQFFFDISNFFLLNRIFALMILVAFFSFAGVPPIGGFFVKFSLLSSLFSFKFFFLSFFVLIFSLLSSFYYLRVVKVFFFDSTFCWVNSIPFVFGNSFLSSVFCIFLVSFPFIYFYGLTFVYSIILQFFFF